MKGLNMMRALALGGAMAMGKALAPALDSLDIGPAVTATRHRGKGKGKRTGLAKWVRPTRTSSRKLRNPNDPAQAYLIARAEAKRERRSVKLRHDLARSYFENRAHNSDRNYFGGKIGRFNPFNVTP